MPFFLSAPLWLLLNALGLLVAPLSLRAELVVGRLLGRFLLATRLFRHGIARENIRRCLPELGPAQREELLRRNFEHYGILTLEFLHFFTPIAGHYRRYIAGKSRLEGLENWDRARARGKGVLFVSLHMGFWEAVGGYAALGTGRPVTAVTKIVKPPWLHRRVTDGRLSLGVGAAFHPGSIPAILRALRRNEAVAFMNDQYARPPMGIPIPFFGVEVHTLGAVATIAQRTGAAILPGWGWRDENGVMQVRIEPALEFGEDLKDPVKVTTAIAARVERWVRAHPEQWLWLHRRFKHVTWTD
ncbi:MAG: hypothetical protein WC969_11630 [Elusimicrobiota bacterium]|jgi:KDO2-lipid IV(A) lauroyltransferase